MVGSTLSELSSPQGRELGYFYANPDSVWLRASPRTVNFHRVHSALCSVHRHNRLPRPGVSLQAISPMATRRLGWALKRWGPGSRRGHFCSITKLSINTFSLQARFSLGLLLCSHLIFWTAFVVSHAFEANCTCLSPLISTCCVPGGKISEIQSVHVNKHTLSTCYLQGAVLEAGHLMTKENWQRPWFHKITEHGK